MYFIEAQINIKFSYLHTEGRAPSCWLFGCFGRLSHLSHPKQEATMHAGGQRLIDKRTGVNTNFLGKWAGMRVCGQVGKQAYSKIVFARLLCMRQFCVCPALFA
jgi:hypothetical protein